MTDNGIVWEEPPPKKGGKGKPKFTEFFDALRANPKRWALLPSEYKTSNSATSSATLFAGRYGEGFEFTARATDDGKARLYVRYVGDAS